MLSSWNNISTSKNNWHTGWWKFSQQQINYACHFKEKWQFLLATMKIWSLKQKSEFWKILIYHHDTDNFQTLQDFPDKMGGDKNNWFFWYHVVKHVNLWRTSVTWWRDILPVTNASHYKIMYQRSLQMQGRPMDFNVQRRKKSIDMFSDSPSQLNVKKLPLPWLSCGLLSKKNIHNYLKRLMK